MERGTREREKVIEEKEIVCDESQNRLYDTRIPLFIPHEIFFNLSLKSSSLYSTFNRS